MPQEKAKVCFAGDKTHISKSYACHRKQATSDSDRSSGDRTTYIWICTNPFLLRKHNCIRARLFVKQRFCFLPALSLHKNNKKDNIIEDNNIQYSYFTASLTIIIIQAGHLHSDTWKTYYRSLSVNVHFHFYNTFLSRYFFCSNQACISLTS